MTDDQLRALWRDAGGSLHGPNVETGTMPESKLLPFLRGLLDGPAERMAQSFADHIDNSVLLEDVVKSRDALLEQAARMFERGGEFEHIGSHHFEIAEAIRELKPTS